MKCALCGREFDERQAQNACAGCVVAKGCKLIRCPNCGYETTPTPGWLQKIVDRRKHDDAQRES